tara:strand:- start:596 stop:817 length:222 start_codon:yes stop_codon:yes gene_type:complete
MDINKIIFNQNTLKVISNIKETYIEKEKDIKKNIGDLNPTTFYGILAILIISAILFPLGILYIFYPDFFKDIL